MKLRRLFIGGYQELKRPVNVVDESLMLRMEEAARRVQMEGRQIPPLMGPLAAKRRPPAGLMASTFSEWPEAANGPQQPESRVIN
jgi:hypothetical protein